MNINIQHKILLIALGILTWSLFPFAYLSKTTLPTNDQVMLTTKKCNDCKKDLEIFYFGIDKSKKDGLRACCKKCNTIRAINYNRTKEGLVTRIYADQKRASRKRGYELPTYSKNELKDWLLSQPLYHKLFDKWILSGYNRLEVPSVDRKNDYLSYTMDNIQLMTWRENSKKANRDIKNGVLLKTSRAVKGFHISTGVEYEFFSAKEASRSTGAHHSHLIEMCIDSTGKNHVGGYKWSYI